MGQFASKFKVRVAGGLSHKMAENDSIKRPNWQNFFKGWRAPFYQSFDWGVAHFAVGIAIYFALPFEPDWKGIVGLGAVFAASLWLTNRYAIRLYPFLFSAIICLLGFGRSAWHSAALEAPRLPSYERSYQVTGWIEAIEQSGSGLRWRIRVKELSGLGPEQTPLRVRVKAKTEGFAAGDGVRVLAVIARPPGPVVPDGYDPARRAYFQTLGGYGFAIGAPKPAQVESEGLAERVKRGWVRYRYGLAERIRAASPPATAGLQTALLTGVRSYIPREQTEALRTAGLAHVLAISGLHMGLLAGGSFWLASLLISLISPLSRRMDVRKPAAIIGALAATGYLIVSGASVATQRAFIMAIIVFLAVLLDRRAFSLRSVSLAALITLVLRPESLISVGFQMSFAAVAALVVVYRAWEAKRGYQPRGGMWVRLRYGLSTLTVTSFVAGLATGGFAVLHFNRIARYGLLGNVLAMPIFTFIVMPAALASLIAMPFGLESIPLAVMGASLSVMLSIAGWVAQLPGALIYIAAAPPWLIALLGAAFLYLTLGQGARRVLGVALTGLCFVVWSQASQPDMRVSDSGQVAFWGDVQTAEGTDEDLESGKVLFVGRKRSDRYGREQFMQRAGQTGSDIQSYEDSLALCDALACRFNVKGQQISVVSHPSEVPEECANSVLIILTKREAGPVARRGCAGKLLDERVFRAQGAQDVYISAQGIELRASKSKARAARPWAQAGR